MPRRRLLTAALLAGACFNTACFLRFTLGYVEVQTLSEEIELSIHAIQTQATIAICQTDPFFSPHFYRCTYFINGVEIASTTSLLSEFGPFGALFDPVILELPSDVTNIQGTYNGSGGSSGNLIVYPQLSFIPADETRTFSAGSGKQLAIVDMPAGTIVSGETYTFDLTFRRTAPKGAPPVPIKALFAGKVFTFGKHWYPPILPCTTNFASLPSLTLPVSSSLQPVAVPNGLTGCANENYHYFTPRPVCDLDNDNDVDRGDLNLIMAVRNMAAAPGDPRDFNNDGVINANDARYCSTRCTRPACSN